MKHRLFFYGTLVPVLAMFGFMYTEYVDKRQTVFDTHERANRQIELLAITHKSRIDDQAMRHMAITHKLQCSQQHDLDALIAYYTETIENLKNEK